MQHGNDIDIQLGKLIGWLVDRQTVSKTWSNELKEIHSKVKQSLLAINNNSNNDDDGDGDGGDVNNENDENGNGNGNGNSEKKLQLQLKMMVKDSEVNLDYLQCKRMRGILLASAEGGKRSFFGFGGFSSRTTQEWDDVVKGYEKQNLYIAELAYNLHQIVVYDLPNLRKNVARCAQTIVDAEKKEQSNTKTIAENKKLFDKACKDLNISGVDVEKEVKKLTNQLPHLFASLEDEVKKQSLRNAILYFAKFRHYLQSLSPIALTNSSVVVDDVDDDDDDDDDDDVDSMKMSEDEKIAKKYLPFLSHIHYHGNENVASYFGLISAEDGERLLFEASETQKKHEEEMEEKEKVKEKVKSDEDDDGIKIDWGDDENGNDGNEVKINWANSDDEPKIDGKKKIGEEGEGEEEEEEIKIDWGDDDDDDGSSLINNSGEKKKIDSNDDGDSSKEKNPLVIKILESGMDAPKANSASVKLLERFGLTSEQIPKNKRILEYSVSRNLFINDLMEIQAFLKNRFHELSTPDSTDSILPNKYPEDITAEICSTYLSSVSSIILQLTGSKISQLISIQTSPKYVDRLVASIQQKKMIERKMNKSIALLEAKKNEMRDSIADIKPKISALVDRATQLKKITEEAISAIYDHRKVNIYAKLD